MRWSATPVAAWWLMRVAAKARTRGSFDLASAIREASPSKRLAAAFFQEAPFLTLLRRHFFRGRGGSRGEHGGPPELGTRGARPQHRGRGSQHANADASHLVSLELRLLETAGRQVKSWASTLSLPVGKRRAAL
jgi:hypothetical protein